jgi:NifU-like protein
MWEYTDKVKDHFFNPRNVGEVENPDGIGEVGSLACGDALRLTFKLGKDGKIADAKFKTFGCGSAIASASALTEIIKGKTIEEVKKITNRDIADFLGGLPEEKMHCSVMGREALDAAIMYYKGETGKNEEGEIICSCFGVTDKSIERAIKDNGLTNVEQVTYYTKAGGGCGNCVGKIQDIINRVIAETGGGIKRTKIEKPQKLSNIQKVKLVEKTIDEEVRPSLRKDGGDIELVDIEGDVVKVVLRGHCAQCALSEVTIKEFVQSKLREFVSPNLIVVELEE